MKKEKEEKEEKKEDKKFLRAGTRTDRPITGSTRGLCGPKKEKKGKELKNFYIDFSKYCLENKRKTIPSAA